MSMFSCGFQKSLYALFLVCVSISTTMADEVVIGERNISVGDFHSCSSVNHRIQPAMGIIHQTNTGEVCAGDLWQFFNQQGVHSLDRLTLCLDLEKLSSDSKFDLQSVELLIEDPSHHGSYLTNVSLGNNTLIVPGEKTSAILPEAKLEILLGYDFMERFSATSQEKIKLDIRTGENSDKATFSIESGNSVFTRTKLALLFGFIAFWMVVFLTLNYVTKPVEGHGESLPGNGLTGPHKTGKAASNRALSA